MLNTPKNFILVIWILLIGLGIFVTFFFNLKEIINWHFIVNNFNILKDFIELRPIISPFIYFGIYILIIVCNLPFALFLTLLAGCLFSWWAIVFLLFSTTFGSFIVFLLAKSFLNLFFLKKYKRYLDKTKSKFEKTPFMWLLTIRLFPFFPLIIGNIVPAVFEMKNHKFVLATLLGILPSTILYVSIGIGLDNILSIGQIPEDNFVLNTQILLPLCILFLISLVSLYLKLLNSKD